MATKNCISCGMPMTKPADHAQGDVTKDYCLYCARPDGSMKSYDEALAGMAGFMMKTQGLAESAATQAAKAMLANLPAWRGH